MSIIDDHLHTIIIVVAVVGSVIVLGILLCIFLRIRRSKRTKRRDAEQQRQMVEAQATLRTAPSRQIQTHTQSRRPGQGQRQVDMRNPNDVEYGIDTRPETLATSYYGGMADVSYFRPGPDGVSSGPSKSDAIDKSGDRSPQARGVDNRQYPSPARDAQGHRSPVPANTSSPTVPGSGKQALRLVQPPTESRYGAEQIHDSPTTISRTAPDERPPPSYASALNGKS